jgi:ribonuclease HI
VVRVVVAPIGCGPVFSLSSYALSPPCKAVCAFRDENGSVSTTACVEKERRAAEVPCRLVHDLWSGWGTAPAANQLALDVLQYTDGSFDRSTSTLSWAVVIGDDGFDDNLASVPIDETLIRTWDVGGATMVGSSIRCTQGVYFAELQAIALAMHMLPASAAIRIHSDSRSSLEVIYAYKQQLNERKRLRMSAHPILQLIHRLMQQREAAGGSITLSHVKAHTDDDDARHSSSAGHLRAYRDQLDPVSLAGRCIRRLVIAAVALRSVRRDDEPHAPRDMPGDEQRRVVTRAQRVPCIIVRRPSSIMPAEASAPRPTELCQWVSA